MSYEIETETTPEGLRVSTFYDDDMTGADPRTNNDTPSVLILEPRVGRGDKSWSMPAYFEDYFPGGMGQYVKELRPKPAAVVFFRYDDYGSGGQHVSECEADEANGALLIEVFETILEEWPDTGGQGALDYLRAELKEWGQWAAGEVYGYTITDATGAVDDSCWGFIGQDNFERELEEAKGYALEALEREQRERADWAARDTMTVR